MKKLKILHVSYAKKYAKKYALVKHLKTVDMKILKSSSVLFEVKHSHKNMDYTVMLKYFVKNINILHA